MPDSSPSRLKAIQHPQSCAGKAGRVEVRSIPRHPFSSLLHPLLSMSDQTFKDLFHVVPAASRAYIYIATAWTCEEESGTITREWGDGIYDILAYATTRAGWGAFLVNAGSEGPMWMTPRSSDNLFIRVFVQDERPEARGGFWPERDKVVNGNYDKEVSPLDPDYSDEIDFIFAE